MIKTDHLQVIRIFTDHSHWSSSVIRCWCRKMKNVLLTALWLTLSPSDRIIHDHMTRGLMNVSDKQTDHNGNSWSMWIWLALIHRHKLNTIHTCTDVYWSISSRSEWGMKINFHRQTIYKTNTWRPLICSLTVMEAVSQIKTTRVIILLRQETLSSTHGKNRVKSSVDRWVNIGSNTQSVQSLR